MNPGGVQASQGLIVAHVELKYHPQKDMSSVTEVVETANITTDTND